MAKRSKRFRNWLIWYMQQKRKERIGVYPAPKFQYPLIHNGYAVTHNGVPVYHSA